VEIYLSARIHSTVDARVQSITRRFGSVMVAFFTVLTFLDPDICDICGSLLGLEYVVDGIHYMIRIRTVRFPSGLHVQVRGEIFIPAK
jgi:hypothetical protein